MSSVSAGGRRLWSRQALLGLALLAAASALVYLKLAPPSPAAGPGQRPRARGAGASEVPRIDLARLAAPPAGPNAGRRDLFAFGAAEPEEEEDGGTAPTPPPTPPPVATPHPQGAASAAPRLVAINLKYIGSLEAQGGVKVAVLLTDRNEILYGQVGQQVANRFKILKIGFESVEVLDEGSGQSRRIPLKGN